MTIVAVPVLNAQGAISHTLASFAISSQLDCSTTDALAHDMQIAAGAASTTQDGPART